MRFFIASVMMFSLFCTSSVFAAAKANHGMLNCFQAIVSSKQVSDAQKDGWNLKTIDRVATYRCIGCYGFDVSYEKYDAQSGQIMTNTKSMMTKLDGNKLVVTEE